MTTSDFIRITQRIIDRDGFDGYLPTLLLPARKHIEVLEGVPPEVNIEEAARDWADRTAEASEDFFLAFKLSQTHFKVVARVDGQINEQTAPAV